MKPVTLPLDSLLIRLSQKGFALDPSIRINVQKVMDQLGQEYFAQPEKIKLILGPVLANNEEEQILFKEVFDQWYKEEITFDLEENQESNSEYPNEKEVKAKVQKRRVWLYPAAIASVLVIFAIINFTNRPANYSLFSDYIIEDKAEPLQENNQHISDEKLLNIRSDLRDRLSPENYPDQIQIGSDNELVEGNEITISLDKAIDPSKSVVKWRWFGDHAGEGSLIKKQFNKPGLYHLSIEIFALIPNGLETSEILVKKLEKSFIVQPRGLSAQALHTADLQANTAKQNTIKIVVLILAICMIILIEGYLYRYGQSIYTLAFQREFAAYERGKYKLPFPAQNHALEAEPALYELANSLKYRYAGTSTVLDVPQTIKSTIKAGGFPELAYTSRTEASEYLVLIDESGDNEYQAKLFEQLMILLKKEEVPIHLFRFRNDPRNCYNPHFPEGIDLEVLAQRFYRHKLLIFSKGTFMVHPIENRLHDWVEPIMKRWNYRALLSPETVENWGIREKLLQDCFTILPTDLESQKGITEALLAEEQPDFDELKEQLLARKTIGTPLEDYDFESIADLHDYLGDALFQWVAATSVYPEPRWEMTLKIGQALEEKSEVFAIVNQQDGPESLNDSAKTSRRLITYQNLNKLSAIPWLREGTLTPELRKLLRQNLDPETEKLAREAALALIGEVETESTSPAAQEKSIQQAIQEAFTEPSRILQKKLHFLWKENMLSAKEEETLKGAFQPNWAMKLGKMIPARLVAAVMIPLIILSITGVSVYQEMSRDLFTEYFQPLDLSFDASTTNEPETNQTSPHQQGKLIKTAMRELEDGNPELAIENLSTLKKMNSDFSSVANWYTGLAYLKMEKTANAKRAFMKLASQQQEGTYQILSRRILQEM